MRKDEWTPVDGIVLEDAATNSVKCNRNVLVVAGPGAGKTELLAQKAGYLFSTEQCYFPKKILAISFKKDAADNLRERVVKRFGEEYRNRFVSLTYDAFFKNILDRFYRALPKNYVINPKYEIANDEMLKERLVSVGFNQPPGIRAGEFRKSCVNLVNRTSIPVENNALLEKFWDLAIHGSDEVAAALSFYMIAKLTLLLLQSNALIKKIICATYSYVFLDEFQDTTEIQYEIIKEIFKDSNVRITAVGDNKQRIMLWAGALKTVFGDFVNEFTANNYQMIMNHRSAPRLVELQKDMYASLNEKSVGIEYSKKWDETDGIINLLIADNDKVEAKYLANMILNDISSGIRSNDICILCKQLVGNYSHRIIETLSDKGIRARIENDYQDFLKDEFIGLLLSIIMLSNDRKNPKSWEELMSFCMNVFPQAGDSNEKYSTMINDINALFGSVEEKLASVDSENDIYLCIQLIVSFFGEDCIKSWFPEYKQGTYLRDRLVGLSKLIWNEASLVNNNWKEAIENFNGKNSIPIMTIHKSKGLEYSSVYFVGLEDSAFWSFKKQPEEDRCAFFVALSRAKQVITFTYCDYRYNLQYPKQKREDINEFYDLLRKPEVANVILAKEE